MSKRGKMLLLAVISAVAFTACNSSSGKDAGSSPGSSDKGQEAKPIVNVNEPVELVFYSHAGNSVEFFNSMFRDPLKKKYPNLTVKYIIKKTGSTLPEVIAAGEKLDIYLDAAGIYHQLNDMKLTTDLTELIKKHNIDLNAFESEGLNQSKFDGKQYGLPVLTQSLVTYYNTDLFNKFGIPLPKDGMTWDEANDIGRKLTRTEEGKQIIGLWVNPKPYLRQNQFSLPLVDAKTNKVNLSSDKWKLIMNSVYMMPAANADVKASLEKKFPGHPDFYTDQRIGMYVMLNDLYFRGYEPMKLMNWNMVSIPTFKEAPGIRSQDVYVNLFPLSTSDKKDWVMEVLKYLTSEEHQTYMSKQGYMTPLKSQAVKKAMGQDTAFKDKNFYGAMFGLKVAPSITTTLYDDFLVQNALDESNLKDLQKGLIDVNTALRQAEDAANQLIAAEISKN